MLHAVEVDEALIDTVAEVCRNFLADRANYTPCQFSIKLIIGREYSYLLVWKLLV